MARSASKLVREMGVELDARSLFQTSLKDYDVVIHLSPKTLKSVLRADGSKNSLFKNLDAQMGKPAPSIIQYPAKVLLSALKKTFDSPLLFFHGDDDDRIIGAIWNPRLRRRTFRANLPSSFRPVRRAEGGGEEDEELVEVDRQAVLSEIARIGGDLVESIEVKGGE